MLGSLLDGYGYATVQAADAGGARRTMTEQNFDLVLCDIKMPGESGMDLARDIVAEYPGTGLVMISGIHDPEVAKDALEIGAYG
ncbi:MAG: response regulator [Pseudomonadota bacterium]